MGRIFAKSKEKREWLATVHVFMELASSSLNEGDKVVKEDPEMAFPHYFMAQVAFEKVLYYSFLASPSLDKDEAAEMAKAKDILLRRLQKSEQILHQ